MRNKKSGFVVFVIILSVVFTAIPLFSEEAERSSDSRSSFYMILENDFIVNTDKAYTNGLFFVWTNPWTKENSGSDEKKNFLLNMTDRFSLTPSEGRERRTAFSFGQAMYAPDNIKTEIPDPDDFPYAGIITGKMNIQYQNRTRSDAIGILIGLVGPDAHGEWSQKRIHNLINVSDPKGWDHQLRNELLVNVNYIHKWKLYDNLTMLSGKEKGFDVTAYTGADLGNFITDFNVGAVVRVGNGGTLFPLTPFKASAGFIPDIGYSEKYPFFINLLAGIETSWVLRSIVIDGNTFKTSASLDREPFVTNLFGGVSLGFKGFWLSLTMVRETEEHKKQDKPFTYGSFILGRSF